MNALLILAQTPAASQPTPWWLPNPIFVVVGLLALFILFGSRGRKGEQKARDQMLSALKKGDRVQTIGGIIGTVLQCDDSEVLLKVDETSNTKIRFSRSAIHRVVQEEAKA